MYRIATLVTFAAVLLGASAAAASNADPASARPIAAPTAPPPGTVAVELRGPTGVATLRARGLANAAATRAGVALDDLDELFDDPTVFAGASGEIGHSDPPPPADGASDGTGEISGIESGDAVDGDVFELHSRPDSTRSLLLDFDGHTTSGTFWNSSYYGGQPIVSGAFDIDGDPSTFSSEERARIATVWQMVAEDYAPFDVNVTTADPGSDALRRSNTADSAYGVRIVVTSTDWYELATGRSAGGVAYLGSVMWDSDTPGFVFAGNLAGAAKPVGEAASHEAGHAAGLRHDGVADGSAYYTGHGDWAPIMGVGYYRSVTQWSRGEYANADNPEDDLTEIASRLALAPDDHGDDAEHSTRVAAPGTTPATVEGVIGVADVDTFRVEPTPGSLTIRLRPAQHTNLAAQLVVMDADGGEIGRVTASPQTGWEAELVVEPSAEARVIEVRAGGYQTPLTGFSPYASMGAYSLTFTAGPGGGGTTTTTTVPSTTVPPTTTAPTTPTVPPDTTTSRRPARPGGDGLVAIAPQRLADTRVGLGGSTRLAPGTRMELQVTGRAGIPSTATAAVLSVVAVNTAEPGFLTVFPCTRDHPTASTLNHAARTTVANTTIATLDRSGKVCVYSQAGADVVVDATGWIGPSGTSRLTPIDPVRAADTRTGQGGSGRLAAGATIVIDLSAQIGDGARAAAVNIAAVNPADDGYLTVWPCGELRPGTSTLNYGRGATQANNAIVGIDAAQRLCLSTFAATDVVVDVTGHFSDDGLGYVPAEPKRLLDTRGDRPLTAQSNISYSVDPASAATVVAASVNVTSVRHATPGHLTTYGCGQLPTASTVNHRPGAATANGAIVAVTDEMTSCVWSLSSGDVVVDLLGWWVR